MSSRKLYLCFSGAALATALLTTGCRGHHDHHDDDVQPAQTQPAASQPAPNETVIYNRWEVNTHRPHVDLNRRTPAEQREYNDWRRQHPDGR
jgi:hypothetical protein